MSSYPPLEKKKQQKNRKGRLLIFGLLVAAFGLFGGVYYYVTKVGSIGSFFQGKGNAGQAPITEAPGSPQHCSVKYSNWTPYFFHDKLIYCDPNYKSRVKTNIDAEQVVFADQFSEGLARVSLKGKGSGDHVVYIGTSGKIAIAADPNREFAGPFSEGLAFAVDRKTGKVGFIDKQGKYAIAPQFYLSTNGKWNTVERDRQFENFFFSSGLAPVYNDQVNPKLPLLPAACGYIDHKGHYVIPTTFLIGCAFENDLARVLAKDDSRSKKRWGFIDTHGKRVIPSIYMQAQDFSEDLGAVLDFQGRWGFLDKAGRYVIPAQFSDVGSFSEGLATAAMTKLDKKQWGYIKKDGSWLIEPRFDTADAFEDGEAHASSGEGATKEDYWINTSGKIERHKRQIIPFEIQDFDESAAAK
jgi:hypothetical protein